MKALSVAQVAQMSAAHVLQTQAAQRAGGGEATDAGTPSLRASVTSVVVDSRQVQPGSLFVALPGERSDGHAHLASAVQAGAVAALIQDLEAAESSLKAHGLSASAFPLLLVEDSQRALGELARAYLALLREEAIERGSALTVVGMTGSVGKTTTKDLTRQILSTAGPTIAPIGSFNNEVGLPLTVLRAEESTRFLVLEMGASGPGHLSYLTSIAPLDAAAVLMVGHAHMGGFGSLDGVAAAKAEILSGLCPGGVAVLNVDDPQVAAMQHRFDATHAHLLRFSPSGSQEAEIKARDIHVDERAHAHLTLSLPGPDGQTIAAPIRLGVPGLHHIGNAMAAAGLALAAGLESTKILAALDGSALESPHRMDVHEAGPYLLIDDSYNANIDSLSAALRTLPQIAGERRKVAILSEMLELGESSTQDHRSAGELAAQVGVELAVLIGAGYAPAVEVLRAHGVHVLEFANAEETTAALLSSRTPLNEADAIVIKGSHGSGAWKVADALSALGATSEEQRQA